jgi:hypothetical protein
MNASLLVSQESHTRHICSGCYETEAAAGQAYADAVAELPLDGEHHSRYKGGCS